MLGSYELFKRMDGDMSNYFIGNFGSVYSCRRWTVAKNGMKHFTPGRMLSGTGLSKNNHYLRVDIRWKKYNIHRLVCKYFVENKNPEIFNVVNHLDGVKTNNYYKNLEWTDTMGNNLHAIRTGLMTNHLTENDKKYIRNYSDTNGRNAKTNKFLSDRFNRCSATIRNIANKKY